MSDKVAEVWNVLDLLPPAQPGEPTEAMVPALLWERLPPAIRNRVRKVARGVLGPAGPSGKRLVKAWLVPVDDNPELAEALEYLMDIELAERAAAEFEREREARLRAGVEPGIPAAVVHDEIAGRHPIAAWRRYRGRTQLDLAREVGIDRGYLAQLERSGRSGTPDTLAKIARALGCLVDDLIVEGS